MTIHIAKCIGDVTSAENFVKQYQHVDKYMKNIYIKVPFTHSVKKQMNIDL